MTDELSTIKLDFQRLSLIEQFLLTALLSLIVDIGQLGLRRLPQITPDR